MNTVATLQLATVARQNVGELGCIHGEHRGYVAAPRALGAADGPARCIHGEHRGYVAAESMRTGWCVAPVASTVNTVATLQRCGVSPACRLQMRCIHGEHRGYVAALPAGGGALCPAVVASTVNTVATLQPDHRFGVAGAVEVASTVNTVATLQLLVALFPLAANAGCIHGEHRGYVAATCP